VSESPGLGADAELRYLKGVGPRRAEALAKIGWVTVEDLLYLLPFRYEDRRSFARVADLQPGKVECTLAVKIASSRLIRTRRRGFTIFEARVADASGDIRVVWYNQPYLERIMLADRHVVLFGRATLNRYNQLVIENPDYEFLDEEDRDGVHTGRIVPVYRKQADLNSRALRQLIHRALDALDPEALPRLVPQEIAERYGVIDRYEALRRTHFPEPEVDLAELADRRTAAQRSLVFEEIFLLQLALALRRHGVQHEVRGIAYETSDAVRTRLARMLPFKLTDAQKRVLREIGEDLRSTHPMNRLLQGDVGSGKTIVALLALLVAVENGYQAALMAPTEILAEQHFRSIRALLDRGEELECETVLLTGSLRAAPRRAALAKIASGVGQLVIGTHALFESGVEFRSLGLAVIDEQHRFGVMQRAALAGKGLQPDVLVMTATPIPRSLSLTFYGDLDLSVIDELPPGRMPVATVVRRESERDRVYAGLRKEIGEGRQGYVVAPLVEETEKSDLKAAKSCLAQLEQEFPEFEVGLVHGRMKGAEKEAVMQRFTSGELQLLVATTVIEVGVDVPNASVMVIEHADRFGLSQLHQLRGRVGRGSQRSYCVLMVGEAGQSQTAAERLETMTRTTDGFRIAEKDLELRGPGAIFGTQQHGLSDLQFLADMLKDPTLLETARGEARMIVEGRRDGPAQARRILARLGAKWQSRLNLARVG